MRRFVGLSWAVALAVTFALQMGVGGASALKNEALVASGSLTYMWHGDTSRGCAAVGVCGVRGELSVKPLGGSQYGNFGGGGPPDIFIGVSGVVRVLRAGSGSGECVDTPNQTLGGLDLRLRSPRHPTAVLQAPVASGRCAGPLQRDLGGISIPVKRIGAGRPSFVMRGTREFAAGPFSGTLVSNVMLKASPSNQAGGFSSSSSSGGSGAPSRTRLEFVQLGYRISSVSSSIQTRFSGASDASCPVLDSCGASGSLTLSVHPARTFTVFANRLEARRRTPGQALSDLRRGRLRVGGFAGAVAEVAESYSWGDGTSCHDLVSTPRLVLALGFPGSGGSGKRIPVSLTSNTGPDTQALRTHCPGPADADLTGQDGLLASGTVTPGLLLSKHLTLTLTEPSGFTGLGYAGSRQGSLQLQLTLTKISSGMSG